MNLSDREALALYTVMEAFKALGNNRTIATALESESARADAEKKRADAAGYKLGRLRCILDKQGTEDSLEDAVRELKAKLKVAIALNEWAETLLCNSLPEHCSQEEWNKIVHNWRDQFHNPSALTQLNPEKP